MNDEVLGIIVEIGIRFLRFIFPIFQFVFDFRLFAFCLFYFFVLFLLAFRHYFFRIFPTEIMNIEIGLAALQDAAVRVAVNMLPI